ncbi:Eukaryotic translation initiation factor 5A [Tulasnella sp. 403]|nr:Eukaryotic translation initiation factor 5A [Tulasnella sp. 403]
MALPRILQAIVNELYLKKYVGRWSDRWNILRVWVAVWLYDQFESRPVEKSAGQAAFLSLILAFIKFPNDPSIVFLFHTLIGGIGMMVVWGWCVLGTKLSLLARDSHRDLETYVRLNSSIYQQNPNPHPGQIEGQLIAAVFQGQFLQAPSSAVIAVWLFIGTYAVFIVRAYHQRLFFIMVFGEIILAIYGTIAPLIPIWYAKELGDIFMIPYAYYLAINIFCAAFVAPQSVSHAIMERLYSQAVLMTECLKLSAARLRDMNDDQIAAAISDWDQNRAQQLQQSDLNKFIAPFLAKEISVQKASGKDVQRMMDLLKTMSGFVCAHSIFIRHVRERSSNLPAKELVPDGGTGSDAGLHSDPGLPSLPYASSSQLRELLSSLAVKTEPQQSAVIQGMEALAHFLDRETSSLHCTRGLFFQPPVQVEELEAALEAVRQALSEEVDEKRGKSGDDTTLDGKGSPSPSSPSYLYEVYSVFLLTFLGVLETFLELAITVEKRPVRIWWPGKQNGADHEHATFMSPTWRKRFRMAVGGRGTLPLEEDNPDRIDGINTPDSATIIEPLAPKESVFIKILRAVYNSFSWFVTSVESTFCLKVSILAVALAVPSWILDNGSAEFYYKNKGIWALVSGVTAKGLFSGETTFGFLQRLAGVFVGGVIAMAMWYISAGNGHGNPYSLAVVFGVAFLIFVPWRIWSTNFLMIVTATTSACLIVGYSWGDRPDSPVATLWNPGQGWPVFWRRELAVTIGITGAWIIDLLPRPKPGREFIRRTYARTILELGNIAASIVKYTRDRPSGAPPSPYSPMALDTADKLRAISMKLRMTNARIILSKLEPSLQSTWDAERYKSLQKRDRRIAQRDAIDMLGLLAFVTERLDARPRTELLASHVFQTPQMAALLNLFYATSTCLKAEGSLPATLPSPNAEAGDFPDLDSELASIVAKTSLTSEGLDRSAFILAEGTCILLGKSDDEKHEHAFEATGSGASATYPMQCSALRKGGHVVIKGRPCKIIDMSTSKTGKHGHAKVHLVATDIFTQKKLEDICPSTHNMDVPNVRRDEYQLVNIDDGFLNLMTTDGTSKDDVKVPDGDLGAQIQAGFDEGKDLLVTIISAMNEESAIAFKEAPKGS